MVKYYQHIENVCDVITSNRRLTVRVVADEVGISKKYVQVDEHGRG